MGSDSSKEFNKDISIKGDINLYICGKINPNTDGIEDIMNYTILKKLFGEFVDNGKIRANNFMNNIYPYENRKLDKKLKNSQIKGKNYNAFLFFNEVNEMFSKILIEEHLYEMDRKNKNNNIIIYFGENEYIKEAIERLSKKSEEMLPFLIIVKNTSIYSEELKYINYIPNLESIKNLLKSENQSYNDDQIKTICEKALFKFIITKIFRMDMYYNQLGYNLNMLNPLNEINSKIKIHLTIGLVGYIGCGKSTLINLLFNQLVSRASSSSNEVTTKCSEYYLPINIDSDNEGQIRFLDFPGIKNDDNYYNIIEPEIKRKINEYQNNKEQIDLVLFYIPYSFRNLNKTCLELINLLNSKKIKFLFIINGPSTSFSLEVIKYNLRKKINNNEILNNDFSNLINTNYYQNYNDKDKTGISLIIENIIDIIKIKDKNFRIKDITVDNYTQKLNELKKLTRLFELYEDMSELRDSIRAKSNWIVAGFSALSFGASALFFAASRYPSFRFQESMINSIFSLYQLDPSKYKIFDIISSGGDIIELKDEYNPKNEKKYNDNNNIEKEITHNKIIKSSLNTQKESEENESILTTSASIKKLESESSKELIEQEIEEERKIAIKATKDAIIAASKEYTDSTLKLGIINYSILFMDIIYGKPNSGNFLEFLPFVSTFVNTYSTAIIGQKLVTKLDEEFENSKQRMVDILKGKVLGMDNIIDQLNNLIKINKN